jgi:TPR repeat protein
MAREKCPVCGGSGKEVHFGGLENYYETCHKCNGTGYFGEDDVYRDRSSGSSSSSSSSYTPSSSGGSSGFNYAGDEKDFAKILQFAYDGLYNRKEFDQAIVIANKLLKSFTWEEALVEAAQTLLDKANRAKADAEADAASSALYNQGLAARKAGDNSKAVELYRKAADMGNADAMCNLGFMYEKGHGVPQDYKKAGEFYRMAIEKGNATAMSNLGEFYRDGFGVKQDFAKAEELISQSLAKGFKGAEAELAKLKQMRGK